MLQGFILVPGTEKSPCAIIVSSSSINTQKILYFYYIEGVPLKENRLISEAIKEINS